MAKTQTEAPGKSGSQFFVVTGPTVQLPPDYALLGTVYAGRKVVDAIGKLGNPQTELPTRIVEIERATVKVSWPRLRSALRAPGVPAARPSAVGRSRRARGRPCLRHRP